MGLTVSCKTAKSLAARCKSRQIFTVSRKKVNRKKNYGDHNGNILTVSRKLAKIVNVSCKNHHFIETLTYQSQEIINWSRISCWS